MNIYIIEQNDKKTLCNFPFIKNYINNKHINYNFIFKSKHIDRGHIFNCTIKHFLQNNEEIIIMGDCDIPLLQNSHKLIDFIKNRKYDFISPYTFLTKLNSRQTIDIKKI